MTQDMSLLEQEGEILRKKIEDIELEKIILNDQVESAQEIIDSLTAEVSDLRKLVKDQEGTITKLQEQCVSDDLPSPGSSPSSRKPPPKFSLPDERKSITHTFKIGYPHDLGTGYITVGFYPNSYDVGEIFITMKKRGDPRCPSDDPEVVALHREVSDLSAFLRGVLDQLAISVSVGLQRGIPLETYIEKFRGTRFPPAGPTKNKAIPLATSIVDYIFRYLGDRYVKREDS